MRSPLIRSSALHLSKGFSLLEVMVALAILGMALVAIFQLFSLNLRSTKKAEDYTKAIFYARSMMDEAFIYVDPSGESKSEEYEGRYAVKRDVSVKSESDDGKVKLYEIIVTATWPQSGIFSIKELRAVYESEK